MTTMIHPDKVKFEVRDEIASLLTDASDDEIELLAKSIQKEGKAYEPVTVWKEEQALIDGHNRFSICKKLNLPLSVEERSFKDCFSFQKHCLVRRQGRSHEQRAWESQRGPAQAVVMIRRAAQNAMAMASATSGGSGSSARPHWVMTACCTWSFVACPFPQIAFFTSVAASSSSSTPRLWPASSTTPRACPMRIAVRACR